MNISFVTFFTTILDAMIQSFQVLVMLELNSSDSIYKNSFSMHFCFFVFDTIYVLKILDG